MQSEREGRPAGKGQTPGTSVPREEIANRAYQRYLERGSTDGFDVDDWLTAEQELSRERSEPLPARRQKASKREAA